MVSIINKVDLKPLNEELYARPQACELPYYERQNAICHI